MSQVITDIFVMHRRPWRCPDCGVVHRGECPNKALHTLYEFAQRIDAVENALKEQAEYLEQLGPFLQEMKDTLRKLSQYTRKLRKEMRQWQSAGPKKKKRSS
ncbi:MAG: hypothetical protein QW793_06255 [Candidatus Caldarchaeum sp.]